MGIETFHKDVLREQAFAAVLNKVYITKNLDFTRELNVDLQNRGVDGYLNSKGLRFEIDEKAQLNYCNDGSISTLGFEASYEKGGSRRQGWLLDEHKLSKGYVYVSSIKTKSGNKRFDVNDVVTSLECFIINRTELIKFLSGKKIDQLACDRLFIDHLQKNLNRIRLMNGITSSFSPDLNEQPHLLLISKSFLAEHKEISSRFTIKT